LDGRDNGKNLRIGDNTTNTDSSGGTWVGDVGAPKGNDQVERSDLKGNE
jgi:hypothetical protein